MIHCTAKEMVWWRYVYNGCLSEVTKRLGNIAQEPAKLLLMLEGYYELWSRVVGHQHYRKFVKWAASLKAMLIDQSYREKQLHSLTLLFLKLSPVSLSVHSDWVWPTVNLWGNGRTSCRWLARTLTAFRKRKFTLPTFLCSFDCFCLTKMDLYLVLRHSFIVIN